MRNKFKWQLYAENRPAPNTIFLTLNNRNEQGLACISGEGLFVFLYGIGTPEYWMPFPEPPEKKVAIEKDVMVGDIVQIVKHNVYKDKNEKYVVVRKNNEKLGLLPLNHITNEGILEEQKTAKAWRWLKKENLSYISGLTEEQKKMFNRWKLSGGKKNKTKKTEENNINLFDFLSV